MATNGYHRNMNRKQVFQLGACYRHNGTGPLYRLIQTSKRGYKMLNVEGGFCSAFRFNVAKNVKPCVSINGITIELSYGYNLYTVTEWVKVEV